MEQQPQYSTPISLDDPAVTAPPPRITPPTTPGPIRHARPASWPTPLGVISIVFGVGGVLLSLVNAASMLLFSQMGKAATTTTHSSSTAPTTAGPDPFGSVTAMFSSMGKWAIPLSICNFLLAAIAGLLIAAGSGICMRRKWGRTWAIYWSILKMLAAILLAIFTGLMQRDQMSTMATMTTGPGGSPNPAAPMIAGMAPMMAIFSACISILWYWAYPTFILIWMYRRSVRAEVASWT
ncbi:MAG: hypothetical protein IT435_04205 [Phycisphaerales bacterium]|nr:hypothetical protein [Phycisphaerales bacterium]